MSKTPVELDLVEQLTRIHDTLRRMDKTLVEQHVTLKDHTRRSLAAEKQLEIFKKQLVPIEKHVTVVQFCVRAVMWLGASGLLVLLLQHFAHKG